MPQLIKTKFYVELPFFAWGRDKKFYSDCLYHMTKVAAMPMYDKKPLKPRINSLMILKLMLF